MALIRDKKHFNIGLALGISFLIVLGCIVSPIFDGHTGLEYADNLFNSLSKGSTYFVPDLIEESKAFEGTALEVTIDAKEAEDVEKYAGLFIYAGADVEILGNKIDVTGDFSNIVQTALNDAGAVFHEKDMAELHGYSSKEVMYYWWDSFKQIDRQLIAQDKFLESAYIKTVVTKGLEPAFNFYGVEPLKVAERKGLIAFLFIFYVVYTVWWGFAIYFLFEGVGITMSKAAEKKEA